MNRLRAPGQSACAVSPWIAILAWIGFLSLCGATEPPVPSQVSEDRSFPPADPATKEKVLRKLDSHIVQAIGKARGELPADFDADLVIERGGRVLCDLTATVTPELLTEIAAIGGSVINSFAASRSIRALIPLPRIEILVLRDDITFIAPAAQATTNQAGGDGASRIVP